MATAGAMRAGGAFVEIFAKDGAFQQAMTRVRNRLRTTGQAMRQFGTQAAMGAGMVGLPMVAALRQFSSFDDAIRATAAVTGSLGAEGAAAFELLNRTARELGATTSFTAIQVANLMTELGRAGFKPDQIVEMTGAVLDLARATGTDATLSAGIMSATIRQFGLEAADAARVADVLTTAANSTFNTVENLGEALQYAGPVAASLGMSLEDTVAILGTLGNVGIQGSQAGTALRRLSVLSSAEADKLQRIFGVAFQDAAGNARPLIQVLGEVAAATNGLPSAERAAKFAEAFGLLGITGATVIAENAADTRELAESLNNAAGAAARTAVAMDAGLGGSLRKLTSAIEGVALAFGDALAPALQYLADGLTVIAGHIRAFVAAFPVLSQIIAGTTAAVFVLGVAAIAGGFALTTLSAGLGMVAAAFAALASPVVATVALVAAGVAGILALAYQLSPAFATEADAIMAALGRLDFAAAFEVLKLNAAIALTQIAQTFANGWASVTNAAAAAGAFIGDKLVEGLDRFMGVFGADILTITSNLERMGLYWKAAFDWDFWRNGLAAAEAELEQRVNRAREQTPTADARAAARTQAREEAAAGRQAANDQRNQAYEATIEELRRELEAARDRARGATEDATQAETAAATTRENAARTAAAAATEAAAAASGPNLAGATAGTFGTGQGLGAGPEVRPLEETAANTARLVDQNDALLTATDQMATRLDRIGETFTEAAAADRPAAELARELVAALPPPTPPPPAALEAATATAAPVPAPADSAVLSSKLLEGVTTLTQIGAQQLEQLRQIRGALQTAANAGLAFL